YYVSSTLIQGQPELVGSVTRVPAAEIESLVCSAVAQHANEPAADVRELVRNHVARVDVTAMAIRSRSIQSRGPQRARPPIWPYRKDMASGMTGTRGRQTPTTNLARQSKSYSRFRGSSVPPSDTARSSSRTWATAATFVRSGPTLATRSSAPSRAGGGG